jgi:NTP pyrophosphatase (non-canonical NTP hydrolase)
MMHFSDYQAAAENTAIYPQSQGLYYTVLGLANEAGEVAGCVKKYIRDGEMTNEELADKVKKELGDVLWYVAMVATEFNLDLNEIAEHNVDKLLDRKHRGVLSGSGDDR